MTLAAPSSCGLRCPVPSACRKPHHDPRRHREQCEHDDDDARAPTHGRSMPRRRAEEYPLRVTSRPPDSTPPRDDSELEDAVRSALDAKDVDGAVTHILRGLGPELLGFMIALTRDPAAAGDAFSELSVDIWRGLPGFEWRASLRTWCYV